MSGREIMVRNAPTGPPNSYSNDGADGDGDDDDDTEGAVEADDDDAEEMVGPTGPLIAPPATVGGGRDGYLSLGFSRIVVVICCCIYLLTSTLGHLQQASTAGFTIFPSFVALVPKKRM